MRLFILLFALLIFNDSVFAQEEFTTEYEVQYEVEYRIDSTNLEDKSTETLYLFTGSFYGVFMNYAEAYKKEIMADLEHQLKTTGQLNIKKGISSDFPKTFYKNLANGEVITTDKIDIKKYAYQEPNLPLKWNMEEETKEIMGYQAQKATAHFAGRYYEAWFTLEIPISDGPYGFSGLPGLIIELYDTQDHYHFTLKSIKKLEEIRSFEFPKSDKIAKTEFQTLQQKTMKNTKNNMLNYGSIQMKVVTTDGMSQEDKMDNQKMKRRIKENRARKNNQIELE